MHADDREADGTTAEAGIIEREQPIFELDRAQAREQEDLGS